MRPEDLRAFAQRSWGLVEDAKVRFRAQRFQKEGPSATFAAAQRLRERFRRLHPNGPRPEARTADLGAHLALKAALDRAANALRGR
jgi:hypothetical protein